MNNNKVKNGTMDLSVISVFGAFWYIPIFTVIYITLFLIFGAEEMDNMSYFSMGANSNRIFMLVMGIIIGSSFIKWAIGLGMTRKQFYKANMYSGAILAVALTITMIIISLFIGLLPFAGTEHINQPLEMHPAMNLLTITLLVYLAYLAGTLIGAGFYRNGWFGTLGIIITILCSFIPEALDPLIVNFSGLASGTGVLMTVVVLIAALVVVNYYFMKDIVIKI
ncbi:hypothetical protein [Lacicoccus qingdaonensis]|uniref:Uncharacterized protein n=1 Tax=Lacicoccus qingdaonensis TaxID=576118 RepID=A0A1G9BM39_9BACL|nr:hypothetical protein [Salinicoccus qingdaonensis]SDK40599.1 hypothetical protein SAMN05216216_10334 [Salinicoccus qingdaonensis]